MKYRKKLLDNGVSNFLKIICSEIGERYSFKFDAIGCDGDRIHLFVGAEPKNSPSRVMQIIKSTTAEKFLKNSLKLENNFGGNCGVMGDTLEQSGTGQLPIFS